MSDTVQRRVEWIVGLGCTALVAWLLWRDQTARLMFGRERVNVELGLWSARFLLAGLAVTPISQVLRRPRLKVLRRSLGLAAAAFAVLHGVHYLIYAGIWPDHLQVLVRRRYLTIGVIAALLLLPLAATSFGGAIRWMGPSRWRALHWLVYPAAILTVLHEVLAWARLFGEVGVHVVLLAVLLAWRLVPPLRRSLATRGMSASAAYKTAAGGR